MTKPHAFGCKRVSLENGFYELFSKPSVHLVDVDETPVVEVTPNGIKTSEKEWEFDLVVCATGYDACTGGILAMNVQGQKGVHLQDKWESGIKTYFGMTVGDFPNMYISLPDRIQSLWLLLTFLQVLHLRASSSYSPLQRSLMRRAPRRVDRLDAEVHACE